MGSEVEQFKASKMGSSGFILRSHNPSSSAFNSIIFVVQALLSEKACVFSPRAHFSVLTNTQGSAN